MFFFLRIRILNKNDWINKKMTHAERLSQFFSSSNVTAGSKRVFKGLGPTEVAKPVANGVNKETIVVGFVNCSRVLPTRGGPRLVHFFKFVFFFF